MSAEERDRLRALFHAHDVHGSGRIERSEFLAVCGELRVSAAEARRILERLDVDRDGTVTQQDMDGDGGVACAAWEDFEMRLGEQAKYIPR